MLKRDISVDIIKIIAMLAVIGLHTLKASEDWRVANVFYETFVIAIPLFFMSSGYCLLGRPDINAKYAIRKIGNIVKFVLILTFTVWSVKSLLMGTFSPDHLIKIFGGTILQKKNLWICWYLWAMAILYAFLPLLNYLYLQKRVVFNSIVVCLLMVEFLIFTGNLNNDGICLEARVPQTFRIWNWLFYFMLGGVARAKEVRVDKAIEYIGLLFLLLVNIFFQEWHKEAINSPYCEYFYSSLVVILLCTLLFKMILEVNIVSSSIVHQLSRLFLPVYIIHPFIIKLLDKLCIYTSISCGHVLCFLLVIIISVSVAYGLMSIPYVNKIFKI